jgi:hypothetical protein
LLPPSGADQRGKLASETLDPKTGWQYVCLGEEWTRGHLQEIQDVMTGFQGIRRAGRQPCSDLALTYG